MHHSIIPNIGRHTPLARPGRHVDVNKGGKDRERERERERKRARASATSSLGQALLGSWALAQISGQPQTVPPRKGLLEAGAQKL